MLIVTMQQKINYAILFWPDNVGEPRHPMQEGLDWYPEDENGTAVYRSLEERSVIAAHYCSIRGYRECAGSMFTPRHRSPKHSVMTVTSVPHQPEPSLPFTGQPHHVAKTNGSSSIPTPPLTVIRFQHFLSLTTGKG